MHVIVPARARLCGFRPTGDVPNTSFEQNCEVLHVTNSNIFGGDGGGGKRNVG